MYILFVKINYIRKGNNMICKAMYYYFVRNYSIYLSFYIGIFIIYLFRVLLKKISQGNSLVI